MRSFRHLLLVAASSVAVIAGAGMPAVAFAQAAAANATVAQPTDPFAQATSDIPADPAVRFGTLPNGMQYAIMRNATPPGQASFRLRIDAGSLMENEDQLGLAHFMEHMAFNGTTNIPENDLLRILERRGLAFGADTNAYTGFDETVYLLELPKADDGTVDDALRVMREQVSEALMAADAVDAERDVIAGEERLRNTPGLRSIKAQFALFGQGQRIANRLPIGDLNIIRNAPRDRFVEFYNGYYRPERATFVAVGDFDVDQMEAKVRGAFESWTPKGPAAPEPDLGTVAERGPATSILVEPGIQSSISLGFIRNPDRDLDTVAERRENLIRRLGTAVLNRRLGEIARGDNPPFLNASGGEGELADSYAAASVDAQYNVGGWKRALETIEQEQRRLIQYGVSDAELQREVTATRTALENGVAGAATRRTPLLAAGLVGAVNNKTVFNTPQTSLDLFNASVEGLTAAQVSQVLPSVFQGQGPLALVVTPVEIEGGEAAVTAALEASRRVAVTAPVAQAELTWPYATFGTPGSVTDRREIAEIGATVVTFANGVTLTVKPTDFRDEQILVRVDTGIGENGMPVDRVTVEGVAANVFTTGGLGKLTADELNRVLNGKIYSTGFSSGSQSYTFTGGTRPADLDLQMQIIAAYLTDPGLRPAPFERFKSAYAQQLEQARATPGGAFGIDGSALLTSGDKRDVTPSPEEVAGWTNDELKAEITRSLSTGLINVVVVGDVTVDAAIASVASTFAALPARGPNLPVLPGADQKRFPAPTAEPVQLTHTGPAEQAFALAVWPTTDAIGDRTEARQLAILGRVLNLRVVDEIREKQALAYGPGAGAQSSDVYPDFGFMLVQGEVAATNIKPFFAAVDTIAAGLRDAPPSQDELDRARLPAVEALKRTQVLNEYWLTELYDVAENPGEVTQITGHIATLEAVTPADIQRLAQKYLKPDTTWRAQVVSSNAAAPAAQ